MSARFDVSSQLNQSICEIGGYGLQSIGLLFRSKPNSVALRVYLRNEHVSFVGVPITRSEDGFAAVYLAVNIGAKVA